MAEWCWVEEDCECRKSADVGLLDVAQNTFNNWEYEVRPWGWWGLDLLPPNGLKEVNSWYVVTYSLNRRGFHAPWPIYYRLLQPASAAFGKYFCPVPYADAKPGDIVVFEFKKPVPNELTITQCAILSDFPVETDGGYRGYAFGAMEDIGEFAWNTFQEFDPSTNIRVVGTYRPKDCGQWIVCEGFPPEPIYYFPPPRRDPLALDLDGGGIRTVGFDAQIHFDYDANGFRERTGWVAPGDGMLMLDKNGNGRLDDGRELVGDFTILPDGTRAPNGFQALSYYDANADGKIDANDPIWSQLRIWEHPDYEYVQGGG